MKIETAVNCGDKVYICSNGYVRPLTVGQIRVYYTKSEGLDDDWNFIGSVRTSDGNGNTNTDPMPEDYKEEYMCVETGIGSGSVWKLGETCWLTEEEAKVACADRIREKQESLIREQHEREQRILRKEGLLRVELEEIEELKKKIKERDGEDSNKSSQT